jgi:hypothetical protein
MGVQPEQVKVSKWNEGIAFTLLFIFLNLMLITVNIMDIHYLYMGEGMPDGLAHRQFVHKGVGMLIFSIILGISILLFFFRGALNFSKNKQLLKVLAYLWVIQNIFMVASTAMRNTMYIDEALLSYKRVGVYFWLLFAFIGLITLFIKLYKNKTVWFLAKYNFAVLFVVFIGSSAFDWDMIISNFNLNRAQQVEDISSYDKKYLLSLSEGNINGLYNINDKKGFEVDSLYSYAYYRNYHISNRNWLDGKLYNFLAGDMKGDWRSYSVRRDRVKKDIIELNKNGKLDSLNLQGEYLSELAPLQSLSNLKELNVTNSDIDDWSALSHFKELTSLSVSFIEKEDIIHFKSLTSLQKLYLFDTDYEVKQRMKKALPEVTIY